jgi:hypothetical protein
MTSSGAPAARTIRSSSVFIATYVQYVDLKNVDLSYEMVNVYCKKFCMLVPISFVQVQESDKPNNAIAQIYDQY